MIQLVISCLHTENSNINQMHIPATSIERTTGYASLKLHISFIIHEFRVLVPKE